MNHLSSKTAALGASAAAVAASLLAGCAVGPNFKAPEAPHTPGFAPAGQIAPATAAADLPGGQAQHFVDGMDIPGQWWTLFQCAELNALIERALKNSPTLEAAQAALRQANENVAAERGSYYPSVSGQVAEPTPEGVRRRLRHPRIPELLFLQPADRAGECVVHARCVRRHPAPGGGAAGAGRIPAVRARGQLSHPHRKHRRRRDQRGLAARADRGHGGHRRLPAEAARHHAAPRHRRRRFARRRAAAAGHPASHACDAAGLAQPARAAAQSTGGLRRRSAGRLRGQGIQSRFLEHPEGPAREPAVQIRRAAAGRPRILRPAARGHRAGRNRHGEHAAADHAHRQLRPGGRLVLEYILGRLQCVEPHRRSDPADFQGRTIAASAPRRRRRRTGGGRQLQGHGHHRLSKRVGHLVRPASRRGCACGAERRRALGGRQLDAGAGAVQKRRRQLRAGADRGANLSKRGRCARQSARTTLTADTAALFQALGGGWWNRTDVLGARSNDCCKGQM